MDLARDAERIAVLVRTRAHPPASYPFEPGGAFVLVSEDAGRRWTERWSHERIDPYTPAAIGVHVRGEDLFVFLAEHRLGAVPGEDLRLLPNRVTAAGELEPLADFPIGSATSDVGQFGGIALTRDVLASLHFAHDAWFFNRLSFAGGATESTTLEGPERCGAPRSADGNTWTSYCERVSERCRIDATVEPSLTFEERCIDRREWPIPDVARRRDVLVDGVLWRLWYGGEQSHALVVEAHRRRRR